MYHSIIFGDLATGSSGGMNYSYIAGKHTWDDWGIIPSSRPLVNPPSPKKNEIEIPGRSGTLDMSTLLTGYMTYQNRTGSWEFIVTNNMMTVSPQQKKMHNSWQTTYSAIMAYLNGKTMKCVLEDDKQYYYEGSFNVNSWKSSQNNSTITIDYTLYPFKRSIQSSEEPWLWDPFNFETGIIRSYGATADYTIAANGSKTVSIPSNGCGDVIYPYIYSSQNNVTLTYDGSTYNLVGGVARYYPGLRILPYEDATFVFQNNNASASSVRIQYRAGVL